MIKVNHAIFICLISMFTLTYYFDSIMDDVYSENRTLLERVWELESSITVFDVTATMYTPTRSQTDSTPHITADGTRLDTNNAGKYRFVAVSRDLLVRWGGEFDYGDYIIVEGCDGHYDGVWQIKDTMHPRITNTIDFLCSKGTKPFKFENVKIYKLEEEIIADNGF